MKYLTSYSLQGGKELRVEAENAEEAKTLKAAQEVIGMMGFNCGQATTGHSPFFDYQFSGVTRFGTLGFRVVTFEHGEAERQTLNRSKLDEDIFMTSQEKRELEQKVD